MLSAFNLTRSVTTCVLGLVAVLMLPAVSPGAVTLKKSMWGPATLGGGSQFPIYADLGVGHLAGQPRLGPGSARGGPRTPPIPPIRRTAWPPALDAAIADAARPRDHGLAARDGHAVVGQRRPPPRWAPTSPRDYADFLAAASRRYPAVRHWMIWGEPTKSSNFEPLAPG